LVVIALFYYSPGVVRIPRHELLTKTVTRLPPAASLSRKHGLGLVYHLYRLQPIAYWVIFAMKYY